MRGDARRWTAVGVAEAVSMIAFLAVLVPPLRDTDITLFGLWFLGAGGVALHAVGSVARNASVIALLAAATTWAVVHLDAGGGVRPVVVVGLLLWAAEEAKDLAVILRGPDHAPGAVVTARIPRYLGVTAAALAADVLLVAVLRDPPVSGWVWRLVGAGALVVLLAVARPRAATGS